MRVRIYVTQDDIDRGQPHQFCQCPIALAAKRRLAEVAVFGEVIGYAHPRHADYRNTFLPTRAANFVRRFDDGKAVKPFSFYLEVPE